MDYVKEYSPPAERQPLTDDLPSNGVTQSTTIERPSLRQEEGLMSPPPKPHSATSSRPRSLILRPGSRLSISLPVQILDKDLAEPSRQSRNSPELAARQSSPSLDGLLPTSPGDSSGFLVALAAQERKVFELKEELHRAELELRKLKRQWTFHEANQNSAKWTDETKILEMYPIQKVVAITDADSVFGTTGSIAGGRIDFDQRRATVDEHARAPRRKIITGGHTRALSLLSPNYSNLDIKIPSQPIIKDIQSPAGDVSKQADQSLTRKNSNKSRHSYQDSATIGVKQIAEDIKSGLWTFMEDLRQATVGDEAIKDPSVTGDEKTSSDSRKKAGIQTPPRPSQGLNPKEKSTPRAHEKTKDLRQKRKLQLEKSTEPPSPMDDKWSDWDSPTSHEKSIRWSDSTNSSSSVSRDLAGSLTEKRNTQSLANVASTQHDEVSWSSLNNFTPGNIKRTASALIKELEKSMNPTLEQRDAASSIRNGSRAKIPEEESRLLLNNLS